MLASSGQRVAGVKLLSPLLAQAEPQVKPTSPLRGENAVIPGVVGLQRCWRFHWSTPGGVQRCCWFQSRHVAAPCARKSLPCAARLWVRARKSSPCKPKMAEKRCFQARWANFFADDPVEGPRWANFFADRPPEAPCWASYFAEVSAEGLRWANFVARGPRGGMVCTTSFGITRAMIVERNRRRRACRRAQLAVKSCGVV